MKSRTATLTGSCTSSSTVRRSSATQLSRAFDRAECCAEVGTSNPMHSPAEGLDRGRARGIMLPRSVKRNVAVCRFFTAMKVIRIAAYGAALFLVTAAPSLGALHGASSRFVGHHAEGAPWIEGVTPSLEDRLFDATYKNFAIAQRVESLCLRCGRLPVSRHPLLGARAARTERSAGARARPRSCSTHPNDVRSNFRKSRHWTFGQPYQSAKAQATEVESTVFSVSADRKTYETLRDNAALTDEDFLTAFGQVWTAPELPQ